MCGAGAGVEALRNAGYARLRPILLPPVKAAGFDLVWFGILMTIVMEMGLIHPPVGLNIFVIRNVAPDIPLRDVIFGVLPFVALMALAIGWFGSVVFRRD